MNKSSRMRTDNLPLEVAAWRVTSQEPFQWCGKDECSSGCGSKGEEVQAQDGTELGF